MSLVQGWTFRQSSYFYKLSKNLPKPKLN